MLFLSWLRNWKRSLELRTALNQTRRRRQPAGRMGRRLYLEALEDRTLLSPLLTATNLTVSGSNGAVVSNIGTFSDTNAGSSVTLTASNGTVVQNSNGTWSWSETTPSGAAQTAPVTIYATDSNGQTAQSDFWLNVGQVFTVTTGVDNGNDSSPTPGSLRWAIDQVNADTTDSAAQPDLIAFNIPTTDPSYNHNTTNNSFDVLTPAQVGTSIPDLPALSAPAILDGYTQPGAQANALAQGDNAVLKIVLNGSQDPTPSSGLVLLGGNSTVRGLVINNFAGTDSGYLACGIQVSSDENVIAGNFIGTDVTGEQAQGNGASGIVVSGPDFYDSTVGPANYNRIGTYGDGVKDYADRNIISGNGANAEQTKGAAGVKIEASSYNMVAGNYIGTDATGTLRLSNYIWGVLVDDAQPSGYPPPDGGSAYNQIGGNSPGDTVDSNLISANAYDGISLGYDESDNTVYGNDIGTDATGTKNLGNGHNGIVTGSTQGLLIGGNVIAYNGEYGVAVGQAQADLYGSFLYNYSQSYGIQIEDNSIHNNGALGIDLGGTWDMGPSDPSIFTILTPLPGVLQNVLQGHSGPNNFQNFPVLTSAVSSSTDTSIAGTFSEAAEPNTQITLDFYANPAADPSGYGQGQTWLGSTTVTTDANGNATFSVDPQIGNLAGEWITATATVTDQNSPYLGDTSEFSADMPILAPNETFAQFLQGALPQSSTQPNSLTIVAGPSTMPDTVINAVNALTNVGQPVTIVLDLGGGTYSANGAVANPPPNVTFVVQNGTLDPVYPALTVAGGQVVVSNCTLTTSGNAPTLLVTGGNVTLSNDTISQTSTTSAQPAIAVSGGTVNMGTVAAPGNNTVSVNSSGNLVSNTTGNAISAVGNTFEIGGTVLPVPSLSFTTLTSSSVLSALVLDPTAGGALSLSGNASISVKGKVVVDSSSKTALTESGNASVKAGSIQVVGGYSKSGNANFNSTPTTGSAYYVADPLAGLPVPTGGTPQTAVNLSGSSTAIINPGIYSKIAVSGNAKLTLNPGIYIITGGGFTVSGSASVTGYGVMIYNTATTYNSATGTDGSGGCYGSITLSGDGTYALSAPTSGPYAEILIFQDRSNARALTLSGNSTLGSSGTIYAKTAALTLSGNAEGGTSQQPNLSFVVDTMTLSGNSTANGLGAPPSGTVAYTPAQIRAAYGINDLSLDGTGQTIAIVDAYDDPDIYQALDTFDSQIGLTASGATLYQQYGPASSFLTVLNQQGQAIGLPSTDPAGAGNHNWEMEEALEVEWVHAIAPGAKIVLVEANSQSLSDLMAGVATAASQPGVSVVSMSWGFAEGVDVTSSEEALYDSTFSAPGVTFVASTGDYGAADPEYPAFSPNVVAVGGTSLTLNANNSYNSETGWGYYSSSQGTLIGSGGGISLYEAEPAFQQGVQSTGYRTTPDVSFVADPATGAWVADPYNLPVGNPFEVVGGTSLSAPAWAGLLALVNQGRVAAGEKTLNSSSPTEAQQDLYSLSQADYNVIASGNNGYRAAPGYNLVTGLGTPVANLLVPDLIADNFPATGRVAAAGAAQLVNSGGSGSINGSPLDAFNVFDALTAAPAVGGVTSSSSQGMTPASSTSVPSGTIVASSGSPSSSSPADQLFADYILLLNDARNAYQTGTFSMPALWQSIDALALQRLDVLWSLEAGAMGVTKDSLMSELFFTSLFTPNDM